MKLEQQVCTREQGRKLFELGIKSPSTFYWVNDDEVWHQSAVGETWDQEGLAYPAFTVAELGVAVGRGTITSERLYTLLQANMNAGHSVTIVLSAVFLSNFLIEEIETGKVTTDEVNNRLNS